jgi:hypothetical protein
MSLSNFFPTSVCELPLLWLSLPDLLRRAKEDQEVKGIIDRPHFWRQKLQNDYNVKSSTDHPLEEYAHCYLPEAIKDGFLFEMGQLGFLMTNEEKKLIMQARDRCAYVIGAYVSGCEKWTLAGLTRIFQRNFLKPYLALHHGDEKVILEHGNRWKSIYSEEMIDHLIKFRSMSPHSILGSLFSPCFYSLRGQGFLFNLKRVSLIEYLLHRYRDRLTRDNLDEAAVSLERIVKMGGATDDLTIEHARKLLRLG